MTRYRAPRAATAPQHHVHAPFLHPCEVCGAWGSFGFGPKSDRCRWFCGEHKDLGEAILDMTGAVA